MNKTKKIIIKMKIKWFKSTATYLKSEIDNWNSSKLLAVEFLFECAFTVWQSERVLDKMNLRHTQTRNEKEKIFSETTDPRSGWFYSIVGFWEGWVDIEMVGQVDQYAASGVTCFKLRITSYGFGGVRWWEKLLYASSDVSFWA